MSKMLRGGRLHSGVREDVAKFTSSIKDDLKLSEAVVDINKAHVVMLTERKIIKPSDGVKLLQALATFSAAESISLDEDIHMKVEEVVTQEAGPETGGNLHIAKSRNDQVVTAIRMELRKDLLVLMRSLVHLQDHITEVAEKHAKTVILEYTHLQPAQPVTFAHYLLSFYDAMERDLQRLKSIYKRVNLCPLGAGALATTSFPIDRNRTAELLGFLGLLENSIDAVSSRDFILETLAALAILGVNISRIAEDFIIWSTPDFGIVELPDEFAGTSSIMPQKKNPEVLEVVRAKSSMQIGNFAASITAIKSLPTTYNLDFQEITPKLWESIEIARASLDMIHKLLPKIKVTKDVSFKTNASFIAATELTNIIVRQHDVPFRTAHKIVGALVKSLVEAKLTFESVTPEMLEKQAKEVANIEISLKPQELKNLADPLKLVEACEVVGGPAPTEVKRALTERKKKLVLTRTDISKMDEALEKAREELEAVVEKHLRMNQ